MIADVLSFAVAAAATYAFYWLGYRRGSARQRAKFWQQIEHGDTLLAHPEDAHPSGCYDGTHAWGEWSRPYLAAKGPTRTQETETGLLQLRDMVWWQERRCQCGNRDFRRVP